MVPNCVKAVTISPNSSLTVESPVADKGIRVLKIRTGTSYAYLSLPGTDGEFVVETAPTTFDFSGYDNTTPKRLILRNNTPAVVGVYCFFEELGSNPV